MATTADEVDLAAVQALQALYENDFIPIALGTEVFLLAAGISVVLHGALPRWLGFAALAFAIAGVTPFGFVALGGSTPWILTVSVLLAVRARKDERSRSDERGRAGGPSGRTVAASSHAGV